MSSAPSTPLHTQIGYSFGQIAGQVFRDTPSILLLIYLTNVIGIEPALAGSAIFVPKLVVGVLSDVTVGVIADRWRQRAPHWYWILAGAVLAPIAMALLFRVPQATAPIQIMFVVAVFSFYMATFSVFSVPYLAMAPRLAHSPDQRTTLMAWRLAFTAIGVLVASGAAPAFIASRGGGQSAYEELGILLGVLCLVSLAITVFTVRRRKPAGDLSQDLTAETLTLSKLKAVFFAPKFSVLLGVTIFQLASAGMSYAAFLYFLIYNMERADAFTIVGGLVLVSSLGMIIAQPLWVHLAKRFGKKPIYVVCSIAHGLVLFVWAVAHMGSLAFAFVLAFLLGVGNSGWSLLGFSMLTDIAAEGQGGVCSAVWVAADKIGFAIGGTVLIGFTLSAFGFSAADAVAGLPQSESAKTGIMFAYGVIPGLMLTAAALAFARWGRDTAERPSTAVEQI